MKKILENKLAISILSGLIFLLMTMPPRGVLSVFTTSEVRPAVVLNVVLGINFGVPAAIGIAIANTVADYFSGYSWLTIVEGIIPQFIYTYVPYILWKKFVKGEDHIHRLDSSKRVMEFVVIVLIYASVSALLCATQVKLTFGVNFFNCLFFVFLNNFTFALVLGCPLMVAMNKLMITLYGNEAKLTKNEKVILLIALIQAIILTILIIIVYRSGKVFGTLDIWNTIYVYGMIAINTLMLISFIVMIAIEGK